MSTKQDLQIKIKNLKNQVSQLQKSKGKNNSNRIKNNISRRYNSIPASSIPTFGGESRPLRIHQTERIGTVVSSTTAGNFAADTYPINPGNATTFPWLSDIAKLFDKYKFHKLKFIFVNNAGSTTAGNVSMGVDFDTLDTTPISGVGMSNLAKFKSFAPWKSDELPIPVTRPGNALWLFTWDSNAIANTNVDLKMYNLGNFIISTEGMAASTTAGYLYVEYDVELMDKNPN